MTAPTMSATGITRLYGTVLVVDDDQGLQDTLCDILGLTGIDAVGVGSANDATHWCEHHNPDLVLLDQRLPDSTGLQLAALLKMRSPLLPVVLLTGFVSADTAIAAVGLVDDYLTKPVPPRELIKVVQTRLEQHRLRVANQELLAQLQEANSRLELTVQERTRELSTARDQAMEASRLKSQFLANMSHEIRTPMNGVIGAADLLATTALSADQRSYVDILSSSGHALLTVINHVLDFSKIEAGHVELVEAPFHLPELVSAVVTMVRPQAATKNLTLALDVDADLPALVLGDGGRIRQVITNLVGNAVKFTDEGQVLVRVRVLEHAPDAVTVRCAVSDSGIGIAPEDVPLLFHDFSQLDPSNTRRFGGTGLGLAISDRLIRLMGGDIGCTPNPGGGTTFWFIVRFAVPPQPNDQDRVGTTARAADSVSADPDPPTTGPLILVVEDNDTNAVILTRMLTLLGYRSHTVRSGADALDALRESSYATVLMDCQMPVMDGFTTTAQFRARTADATRTPVVAITATATNEDQARCLAAGMDDYLPKPIIMERLATTLTQWAPISRAKRLDDVNGTRQVADD
jgi:two-component system sensor histidine kinase/response regulator